jgi:hypothetical protein
MLNGLTVKLMNLLTTKEVEGRYERISVIEKVALFMNASLYDYVPTQT